MKNNNLKIKVSLIFLLCIFLSPIKLVNACGPGNYGFDGYNFFHADLVKEGNRFAHFLLPFKDIYTTITNPEKIRTKTNIEEWMEIFCQGFYEEDIKEIIYGSLNNLEKIKISAENKKKKLSGKLSSNAFAKHLVKNKCQETIDYLIFAKKCEPHVTSNNNYWDSPKRNHVAMSNLISEGERRFPRLKSNNIKLRYAYQLIRLAHYAKKYRLALDLEKRLLPKVDLPEGSIIYNWILAHKAGALKSLGKKGEAAYLFSLVFDKCPSKQEAAFRSFSIQSEKEWREALLLCQSNHERAILHAIRATNKDSKPIKDMQAIYQMDPENKNLELLLVREIQSLEKDFLGTDFNPNKRKNKSYGFPGKYADKNLLDLTNFVTQVVKEKRIKRLDLWQLAQGYLYYLANNFYDAKAIFNHLTKTAKDDQFKSQLSALQLAMEISQIQNLTPEEENKILNIRRDHQAYEDYGDFKKFLDHKLTYEYTKANEKGKAYRSSYELNEMNANPQKEIIEELLEIAELINKTRYQKALTTNQDGSNMLNDLYRLKAIYYFSNQQEEAALKTFSKIPATVRSLKKFNPFIEDRSLCIHCHQHPDSVNIYTRSEILEKIFDLEFQSKSDYRNSSQYLYQIGIAYYNLSYYGHSWNAMDLFRSGSNWGYLKDNVDQYYPDFGNKENKDMSRAKLFFEKVIELGEDDLLRQKAMFWAARCDFLTYMDSRDCKYNGYYNNKIPNLPLKYRRYYRALKKEYGDSAFYQDLIKECSFFEKYATN